MIHVMQMVDSSGVTFNLYSTGYVLGPGGRVEATLWERTLPGTVRYAASTPSKALAKPKPALQLVPKL